MTPIAGDLQIYSSSLRLGNDSYFPNSTISEKFGYRNFIRYNKNEDGALPGVYIFGVQAYSYT